MKKFRYVIEAALVRLLISFFGMLSPARASAIGGALLGMVGPMLSSKRKALRHITDSLPVDDGQARKILRGMWDNLGRIFAEYPHLYNIAENHIILEGYEHLDGLAQSATPAIFFSAHLANWEISAPALRPYNIDVDLIYRAPNNPYVEDILQQCRSMNGALRTYPKSSQGMRQVVSALKQGRRIGILIDQKYNQGVEADFFGRPAMTSTAFIQLAKKFQCPLIPVRVERLDGVEFRVSFYPSLDISKDEDTLLKEAHSILESWITERPEQWLWLHKRWKVSN
ncbi:MAG TPA: lipid A biosynthesis acyltransferase [Alphaproteobacteria bacterium]|nr:lipid A biosynthesis acyltransferase [Alphaproteobacteria bacterium]HOO49710.1 lipid A biosynthesis acyltransferase [Alphaproteobacteria bacterium]